jgi:predicted nucleotidyltransferase
MDRLKDIVKRARSDKDVLAVIVFGSYARNEKHRDIDVCLVLDKDAEKKLMSGKRLSYVTGSDLDVHIFQQLPLFIRMRVIREGKPLYCRDMDMLYDTVLQTIRDFGYFKPVYDDYLEAVKNG